TQQGPAPAAAHHHERWTNNSRDKWPRLHHHRYSARIAEACRSSRAMHHRPVGSRPSSWGRLDRPGDCSSRLPISGSRQGRRGISRRSCPPRRDLMESRRVPVGCRNHGFLRHRNTADFELVDERRHGIEINRLVALHAANNGNGLEAKPEPAFGLLQRLLLLRVELAPKFFNDALESLGELLGNGIQAGIVGLHGAGRRRVYWCRLRLDAALIHHDTLAVPHPCIAVFLREIIRVDDSDKLSPIRAAFARHITKPRLIRNAFSCRTRLCGLHRPVRQCVNQALHDARSPYPTRNHLSGSERFEPSMPDFRSTVTLPAVWALDRKALFVGVPPSTRPLTMQHQFAS